MFRFNNYFIQMQANIWYIIIIAFFSIILYFLCWKHKKLATGYFIPLYKHKNYGKIQKALRKLASNSKKSAEQVIYILNQLKMLGSNTNSNDKYSILKECYRNQLNQIFSKIALIVLNKQKAGLQFPILIADQQNQINFNKGQILYLMSLMALNLVPPQQYQGYQTYRQNNNFSFIFNSHEYKTKTIIQYFKDYFKNKENLKLLQSFPFQDSNESFLIKRQVQKQTLPEIMSRKGHQNMIPFKLQENQTSIQQFYGDIKVDFANKFIGGGSLSSGCVQEEIMFANHPELYISSLFCEVMNANQAIYFSGFKKYSKNQGYGRNTLYAGPQKLIRFENQFITAIDAINFSNGISRQFNKKSIDREILKAFAGFNVKSKSNNIVTGNWGCGVFAGDLKLKFLIQWIACSLAERTMIYCPFDSKIEISKNNQILKKLSQKSVEQVYNRLITAVEGIGFGQGSLGGNKINVLLKIAINL